MENQSVSDQQLTRFQAQLTTLVHSAAFANDTQLSENIETSLGGSDVNA
jgi:hypothetical protein